MMEQPSAVGDALEQVPTQDASAHPAAGAVLLWG